LEPSSAIDFQNINPFMSKEKIIRLTDLML